MKRARMVVLAREHALDSGNGVGDAFVRRAVAHPVAPRTQVHDRLDVEHLNVEVVRELFGDLLHGVGVRAIACDAILGLAGVAGGKRVDETGLLRRRA